MIQKNKYLTIAQASDIHICQDGEYAYKVSDTVSGLNRFISNLQDLKFPVDLLCISGDLSDDGTISSYEILKSSLSVLSTPYYIVPGNHDNKKNMASVFSDHIYLNNYVDNRIFHTVIINNIKIILLDTVSHGDPNGSLTNGILELLERELNTNNKTIIFLHHPPFSSGIGVMDNPPFENQRRFIDILNRSKNLLMVGSGHMHRGMLVKSGNINLSVAPSTAMQLELNLNDNISPAYFLLETPGYLIHRINLSKPSESEIITHVVQIPDKEEMKTAYPFYD